jgi:DNA-binding transcriptional regulator GbsR (MarR family)
MYNRNMDRDKILIFADHMGRFYAQRYGFPPVTGRLIGYLSVCEPMQQSIGDISEALLASRSAINNALISLEAQKLISRTRPAGTRADLVGLSPLGWENTGFEPSEYQQMASLAREGLELLKDATPQRREALETAASLGDFLTEKLPQIYEEWMAFNKQAKSSEKRKED